MDYLKEINEALKNVCKRAYQEGAQERDKIYNQGYEAGRHAAEEEAWAADKDIETEAYNRGYYDGQKSMLNAASENKGFHVGDEVMTDAGDRGVVVAIGFCTDEKAPVVMSKSGSQYGYLPAEKWHKTGMHFEELVQLMDKLNNLKEGNK